MSSLPLHPSIVHIPMALAILMPLIAGGILFAWARGSLNRRSWFIAVALQAILVGGALAAMNTGEADEERVEAVAPEAAIEAHEEAAEIFTWAAVAVLVVFAAAAVLPGERTRKLAAVAATLGTLVVFGLGIQVGHAGGELVYRHNAGAAHAAAADTPALPPAGEHEDHDDD
jgi:uncharacterized membrane protein